MTCFWLNGKKRLQIKQFQTLISEIHCFKKANYNGRLNSSFDPDSISSFFWTHECEINILLHSLGMLYCCPWQNEDKKNHIFNMQIAVARIIAEDSGQIQFLTLKEIVEKNIVTTSKVFIVLLNCSNTYFSRKNGFWMVV